MMLLTEPRPISIMMPVMPLMLSTQPGKGSFQEATTTQKRKSERMKLFSYKENRFEQLFFQKIRFKVLNYIFSVCTHQ